MESTAPIDEGGGRNRLAAERGLGLVAGLEWNLSWTLGFFFAVRIGIVLVAARVLGLEPRTGAAAELGLNLLLLGVICFALLGAAGQSRSSLWRVASMRWIAGFLALSLCSLAWSETVSLPVSLAYWAGMAADVAMVVALLRVRAVDDVGDSLMKGFVMGACLLAVVAWLMPVQADLRLGDEEFFNTNQIGNLCAFAIFLAQCLMRRRQGRLGGMDWLGWAALFLSVTLIRSLSKTTIVAFAISQAYLLIHDRGMSRRAKLMLMGAAVVAVLVFWGLFEAYFDVYTTAGNQSTTLTGRTGIWLYVIGAAIDKPWLGHGFDSMWKVIPPFGPDQFEARHAENELLQQFYAYGVAGIAMLTGLYGSLWRRVRRYSGPERVVFTSLILFIAVRGLAEAEPFDLLLPLWAIALIAVKVAAYADRPGGSMPSLI